MAETAAEEEAETTGETEEEGTDPESESGTEKVTKRAGRDTEAAETTEIEKTELKNWENMVAMVQAAFGEGRLAEEANWKTVVLIPNGGGEY